MVAPSCDSYKSLPGAVTLYAFKVEALLDEYQKWPHLSEKIGTEEFNARRTDDENSLHMHSGQGLAVLGEWSIECQETGRDLFSSSFYD